MIPFILWATFGATVELIRSSLLFTARRGDENV